MSSLVGSKYLFNSTVNTMLYDKHYYNNHSDVKTDLID